MKKICKNASENMLKINLISSNFYLFKFWFLTLIVTNLLNTISSQVDSSHSKIIQKELIHIESDEKFEKRFYTERNFNIYEFEHIKLNFKIQKHLNIIDLEDFNIPSDLLEFLPENETFELILNQGRVPDCIRNKIFLDKTKFQNHENMIDSFLNENKIVKHGNYFIDDIILTDLPSGYMLFMGANEFSFSKKSLKLFFDIFSYVFKITLNPIMDRTNYVNFIDYYLMTENTEKACTDHLDGIKSILPWRVKKLFELYVNYKSFVESDFKSIKIFIKNDQKNIEFKIKIIYRNNDFVNKPIENKNKFEDLNNSGLQLKDNTFNLVQLKTFEANKLINILSMTEESAWNLGKYFRSENENEKEFLLKKYLNYTNLSSFSNISPKRFLHGEIHGFENLKLNHKIKINSNSKNIFRIIDLIPDTLDILFSTIKIDLKINLYFKDIKNHYEYIGHLNKMEYDLRLISNENNFKKFIKFFFTEQIEEQNPRISFTYENKKSTQLNFLLTETFFENLYFMLKQNNHRMINFLDSINFLEMTKSDNAEFLYEMDLALSYELRKKILNFESMENENEVGYKIPSGLVMLMNKRNINPFLMRLTNHVYFNYRDVDGTMPFNIIALSWVVYGFLFIQTLNLFLIKKEEEEKTLLQSIKDRFLAKWGFLFGR